MRTSTTVAAGLTAVGLLVSAGCSSSSPPTAPAAQSGPETSASHVSASAATGGGAAAASTSTLTISGFSFSALTVKPGATVTVSNADSTAHTVNVHGTSTDVTVQGGGTATFTAPTTAGTYQLSCDLHADMHGTLTVAG